MSKPKPKRLSEERLKIAADIVEYPHETRLVFLPDIIDELLGHIASEKPLVAAAVAWRNTDPEDEQALKAALQNLADATYEFEKGGDADADANLVAEEHVTPPAVSEQGRTDAAGKDSNYYKCFGCSNIISGKPACYEEPCANCGSRVWELFNKKDMPGEESDDEPT